MDGGAFGSYWRAVAPAMPGAIATPSDRKKIGPVVMMANERLPVEPIEIGCSSAKWEETAAMLDELHVDAGAVMATAPTSGATLAM